MPDLKKGDIIYSVQHDMIIGYSHYGVYIGGGKVIHFASNPNDGNEKNIHITSLEKFQGDGDKICVRYIPSSKKALAIIQSQLTDELKAYIQENFGDMQSWLLSKIEAIIYSLKNK